MENQFKEICIKLGNIHERIDTLEQQQMSLEDEMKSSTSVTNSSSSSTQDIKTRIHLQVNIHLIMIKCKLCIDLCI